MTRRPLVLSVFLMLAASLAFASPVVTLEEFQDLYPAYLNHALMDGFEAPCVDADGTMTINANVADITTGATEPFAIAMLCQAVGYPAFTPVGPVSFSEPGMYLLGLDPVPGHPDAFAIEFVVPETVTTFSMTIENTGWPEGCVDLIDYAAWDRLTVPNESGSLGSLKAAFEAK